MSKFSVEKNPLSSKVAAIDNQISPHLIEQPLPNLPKCWLIIGGRGSGQPTLALSALKHHFSEPKPYFDNIFLVSKTYKNDMITKEILRELVEDLQDDPQGSLYETLTDDVATEIISKISAFNEGFDRKEHKRTPRNLVILDDQLSQLKRTMTSPANDLIVNGRHLQVTVWCLTQKYYSIPPLWRANAQLISMFATQNKREFKALEDDLNIERKLLERLYKFATESDEGRGFLHINLFKNPPIMYRKFDRIII